jgi:hypothetical protein
MLSMVFLISILYTVLYGCSCNIPTVYNIYWHLGKLPNDTSLMGAEGASGV